MQNLIIREYGVDDVARVKEIDEDPAVSVWQLRVDPHLHNVYFGGYGKERMPKRTPINDIWPAMVVVVDGIVVGYVSFTPFETMRECILGWNFHPSVWGKGVAGVALGMIISSIRKSRLFSQIKCYTNSSNIRCIRFMEKLGFTAGGGHPYLVSYFEKIKKVDSPIIAFQLKGRGYASETSEGSIDQIARNSVSYLNARGKKFVISKMIEDGIPEVMVDSLYEKHRCIYEEKRKANSALFGLGLDYPMVFKCVVIVIIMIVLNIVLRYNHSHWR